MLLGVFSHNDLNYQVPDYAVSTDILGTYLHHLADEAGKVAIALGMIVAFFISCQILFLRLPKKRLLRISIGVIFTYIGLVIFLTGVGDCRLGSEDRARKNRRINKKHRSCER